jgi:hypothetical protein
MFLRCLSPTCQFISIGVILTLIAVFAFPRYQRTGLRLFYLFCLLGLFASLGWL